ncbi:MAG: hypothetical protein RIS85_1844 [Pseudomonadota bacterium]
MSKPDGKLPIVIVGAGFSGSLLAINLLRLGASVVLAERSDAAIAKGLAFGTKRPEHLLNVRASNMSAFPHDPTHFLGWMGFSSAEQVNRFVPRLAYGHYLRELLISAIADAPGRIRIMSGTAWSVDLAGAAPQVRFDRNETVAASAVVLATGNLAPRLPEVLASLPAHRVVADPWQAGALEALSNQSRLLLVGTGLTAVDVIMSLESQGFTGEVVALSRRGLRPRGHADAGPVVDGVARPEETGARLVARVRRRALEKGWRTAVDELRPHTQALWRAHDPAAQARLLRHLRPYWDVHRHRVAPAVAARLDRLEAHGRLSFQAGRIESAGESNGRVEIAFRPRGAGKGQAQSLAVDAVVNCTGPEGDVSRTDNPVLHGLLASGAARPDRHRLGLDVDSGLRVVDASGTPQSALYAVGPLTRGDIWEMVAVPDIRQQVWDLACNLTGRFRQIRAS